MKSNTVELTDQMISRVKRFNFQDPDDLLTRGELKNNLYYMYHPYGEDRSDWKLPSVNGEQTEVKERIAFSENKALYVTAFKIQRRGTKHPLVRFSLTIEPRYQACET